MRQNATETVQNVSKSRNAASWFRRFVESWAFTPLLMAVLLSFVFAIFGYRMQRRESHQLFSVFNRHLALVTRVLEVASEHALRDGNERDLHQIVQSVETHDDQLTVRITDNAGHTLFSSEHTASREPAIEAMVQKTLETREAVTRDMGEGDDSERVVTAVLNNESMPDSVLVVRKSMRSLKTDLRTTRAHAAGVTLVMALFTLIFGLILSYLRVRVPLRRLRTMMDDFEDVEGGVMPPAERYNMDSEVRAVSQAFGELMRRLARSRASVDVLHTQREALVRRLGESSGKARLLQLSSELAHEIGSPLQVILGRAAMLDARSEQPEQVRRHARIVVGETNRIQRIVQRSLLQTTEKEGQTSRMDLVVRTREIADLIRESMEGPHVRYRFSCPQEPVWIRMNSDALDQILRNILANAHEACLERGEIHIGIETHEDRVRLEITDSGRGMTQETLHRALQPFFSTRSRTVGHGFGLPIVQRLCRDYGVTLHIESERYKGTTVVLDFAMDSRTEAHSAEND